MSDLPAFCGSCGLIIPSVRSGGTSRDAQAGGRRIPCPRCGNLAEVSQRKLDLIEEAVEVLGPEPDRRRLERLSQALGELRLRGVPSEGLRRVLDHDAPVLLPALSGLSRDAQRVIVFFLETVVGVLLTPAARKKRFGPEDVRGAATRAMGNQRIFPPR